MAYSTVQAPPKKDGGGGKYTWGSVTDPADYNFVPVGIGGGHVGVVTTAAMPAQTVIVQQPVASPVMFNVVDNSDFPPLGGAAPLKPAAWGPATVVAVSPEVPATPVASTAELAQPRAPELFGQQHPRNMFAPQPRKPITTSGVVAVDWSAAGVPAAPQATNAAHLSKFAAPAPPTPSVVVLRQQQPVRMMPPKVMKPVQQRPMMIHQPQKR